MAYLGLQPLPKRSAPAGENGHRKKEAFGKGGEGVWSPLQDCSAAQEDGCWQPLQECRIFPPALPVWILGGVRAKFPGAVKALLVPRWAESEVSRGPVASLSKAPLSSKQAVPHGREGPCGSGTAAPSQDSHIWEQCVELHLHPSHGALIRLCGDREQRWVVLGGEGGGNGAEQELRVPSFS